MSNDANKPDKGTKFPKTVTLSLDDAEFLKHLAGATGSESPLELMNLAIGTLEWVVQSRKAGKKIYATSGAVPADEDVQELIVEVVDAAEEE